MTKTLKKARMRRGTSPLRKHPRPRVLRPMLRKSLRNLLMMPRAKTPLIVRLKNPQVRAKRRALRSQAKKQPPLRARMDPSKMLRVKQRVTMRQEKQLIPQARRAVRRRVKEMLPLPIVPRQMSRPTLLQMLPPLGQRQMMLLGQAMLEPLRAPVLVRPPLQV